MWYDFPPFEAVCGEYLSRTQRLRKGRAAILFILQMEIYGKPYVRRIYRRGRSETCQCGAHSSLPQ